MARFIKRSLSMLLAAAIIFGSVSVIGSPFAELSVKAGAESCGLMQYDGYCYSAQATDSTQANAVYNICKTETSSTVASKIYNLIFKAKYRVTDLGGADWCKNNEGSGITSVKDPGLNTTVSWGIESWGCMSYAYFVSQYARGTTGSRQYIKSTKNMPTADEFEAFIDSYADPGEHIRFHFGESVHSVAYVASDADGFYFLSENGSHLDIRLYYCTWQHFVDSIVYSNTYTDEYYSVYLYDTNSGKEVPDKNLTFTLNSAKTAYSVTACKTAIKGAVGIPASYKGKPVTSIGANAFKNCSKITYVLMPESITSVGNYAFYGCTSLKKIDIAGTVTSIGTKAFGFYSASGKDARYDDFRINGASQSAAEKYAFASNVPFHENGRALATPDISSVANETNGISIKWDAVKNAAGYYVYKKVGNGSWSQIDKLTSTVTSYLDKSVSNGTAYSYTVKAYKGSSVSGYNRQGVGRMFVKAPALPSFSAVTGGMKISWKAVSGVDGYYIYRKSTGSWAKIDTVNNSSTVTYTDTSAKSGTSYSYIIRSYKGSTASGYYDNTTLRLYIAAPKISSVSNTAGGVSVKWNKVSGADSYRVYRKTTGSWEYLKTVTDTSFTDTSVKNGTAYTYTVRAQKGSSLSSNYPGNSITVLATPSVSSVSNGTAGAVIKWNKVSTADGYYIYRKTGSGSWSHIAAVNSGSTVSYTDKSAQSGVKYVYSVRAYNKAASSGLSATKALLFVKSPVLTSAANSVSGVTVKWSASKGTDTYTVYRKVGNGDWSVVGTIGGNATAFTDTDVVSGRVYYYRVRASIGSVNSAASAGNVNTEFLAAPKMATAVSNKAGIKISYNRISSADGYIIYRKTGSGSWVQIASLKGSSNITYTDKTAQKGTTYTYAVKAYDGSVKSAMNSGIKCTDKY